MLDSACLPGYPAALDTDSNVEPVLRAGNGQRLRQGCLIEWPPAKILSYRATIDGDLAGARYESHPGNGALAPPNSPNVRCVSHWLFSSICQLKLIQRKRFRLLRLVRMIRAGIDLQFLELALAQDIPWQHATHGVLNDSLRVRRPNIAN